MQGELEFTTEIRRYPPDDLPLLTAEIRLPSRSGKHCRAFERYYAVYRQAFFSYCEGDVFPRAQAALETALQTGGSLPEWTVTLDTRVTLQRENLVSLCTDTAERAGGRPLVLRRAETWDLARCALLTPADLFPADSHWKRRLLGAAAEQIRRQHRLGTALYCPDWQRRLRATFSRDHFYLTDRAFCLFYQMYTIAPAAEGIPVFSVPWDAVGPRLPEQTE